MDIKRRSLIYVSIEFIMIILIVFALCITFGNIKFYNAVDNIIGPKMSIIQNLDKMSLDYATGYTITTTLPTEKTIEDLKKRNDISFFSLSIPAYLEIESDDHNNLEYPDTIKMVGMDQRFSYDFVIEKVNIVKGRTLSEEELNKDLGASIVSMEYASKYGLKLGDLYKIDSVIHEIDSPNRHSEVTIQLEIVGIFEPNKFSAISENSEESKFNKEMINSSIYVSNETCKNIRTSLLTEEVNAFPDNYKGIIDPYGVEIKGKSDIINILEKEKNYEINIIPSKDINVSRLEKEISKILSTYPYVTLIKASDRYKKLKILGDFAIPVFIISLLLFIIFNIYILLKVLNGELILKRISIVFMLESLLLYVGGNLGILAAKNFRGFYLFILKTFSNVSPKDYEIPSYNRLDKVILTNENIVELMGLSTKEFLSLYGVTIVLCFVAIVIIAKLLAHNHNSYRRLS
ncbi:hypothetical protein [Enterococcus sp. CWB-B31]|uniref:hypothetical protein n=1 Tax=Enterococcus sp. CWB-B31 TaxID=2885159 RepID=UPI001E51A472|nr:hypothetical protein [Enterococcus sp. CWB-B31]MCB5955087.1 hypothetical protein [Enterococcus sp. CWB-B31]